MPRFMRGWAAVAIAAGAGSALVLRHAAAIADPVSCPGSIDLLAVIASRTWRDVPLSSILAAGNAVFLFLALLLLARAVHTITASIVITIAITLAASASSVFAAALAPSGAAAFVVTIAGWSAVLRAREDRQDATTRGVALCVLALLAATVTPMMLPAAIAAACLGWKRWSLRVVAVVVVLGTSHVMQIAMPREHSCVMLDGGWASLATAVGVIAGSAREAGPLAIALAILGVVAIKRLARDVALSLPVLVLISLWGAALMPGRPAWILAPFAIAFWVVAAAGLAEVSEAVGQTAGGKAGAGALSIVLVVLQVLSANARAAAGATDGHERLTLSMMGAIVGALPRGAALVEEDATTSLLTRALPSRVRASDRFHRVPLQASAITEALASTRVFALPRSQRVVQYAGFEMIDAVPGAPGLAEIRQAHACTSDLGSTPVTLAPIIGQRQFGLVADDKRARDHVVIILTGDVPISAAAVGSTRNFQGRMFDLSAAADQRDFADEIRKYQVSSWSGPNEVYATRIETWRSPGDPLVLPIVLGGTAQAGTARVLGSSQGQHLRLCPAYPYEVRRLW